MMERATGRTYRLALQACMCMSEGKDVLWVYGNTSERRHCEAVVKRLTDGHTLPGKLTWASMKTDWHWYRGHRGFALVIEDEMLGCTWRDFKTYLDVRTMFGGFLKR